MLGVLPYTISFLLPPLVVASTWRGGWWTWLPPVVLYVGLPIVDALLHVDRVHRDPDESERLGGQWGYRLLTWAWVPLQTALVVWAVGYAASHPLTPLEWVGLVLSVGSVTGGIGITYAHELVHRPDRFELLLADCLLAQVSFPQFAVEHVHCHHRHVATPLDPSTARRGENLYRFLGRSVVGGIGAVWRIEAERLRRRGTALWSPANRAVRYALTMALVVAAVSWWAGPAGLAMFLGQSLVAIVLVQGINYVEHYGLVRREVAPGRYERVAACHSWDSSHRITNWLLINLARHADHHLAAGKRYQTLETTDDAPQLPAGYATMMMVALVPPLWRHLVDPRLPPA
ncbi:MAG: alkane 1-monooxygenase [Planctomycetaceae bacterium]